MPSGKFLSAEVLGGGGVLRVLLGVFSLRSERARTRASGVDPLGVSASGCSGGEGVRSGHALRWGHPWGHRQMVKK